MSYSFKGTPLKLKEKYDSFTMTRKGHIIHIVLDRPSEFNSTDLQLYDDFNHFFNAVNFERDVRCIVLTAKGKHFCAGLDCKFWLTSEGNGPIDNELRRRHRHG